ncbi:hypothetical protein [Tautonia marina]|uniref:hypothetical protein n=1 Tax=Tautonia marina TaxID=2653855 RepID=UPI001260E0F3|nr:hypothetical protein [Tautonia marina]
MNHANDARGSFWSARRLARLVPRRARWHLLALLVAFVAIGPALFADRSLGQPGDEPRPERDVTLFGLRADPGKDRIDPLLSPYAAPLRKLVPGHGLTLLDAASQRLSSNQSVSCDLGDGQTLKVVLLEPLGADGKVHLRVQLLDDDQTRPVFVTDVRTPPDQLVFLDKALEGSESLLLIGVGAR